MKKYIFLPILFLTFSIQAQLSLKIRTEHGKAQGFETYGVEYREQKEFTTVWVPDTVNESVIFSKPEIQVKLKPIVELNGNGNKLYLYIGLDRIKEYDSVVVASFNKFKEWVVVANQNNLGEVEKDIDTFTTDGSMISDYVYESGGICHIRFIYVRKQNYSGQFTNTFQIRSYNSSGPLSAIYLDEFQDGKYDYKLQRKVSIDEQIRIFRQSIDYDNIMNQVNQYKQSLSILK
jgi:hypothetical protein